MYVIRPRKATGEFYVTLHAKNGQVIFKTENFSSKAACYNAIESCRLNAQSEIVEDKTE